MNSWVAGGIVLSWVASRYQEGIVLQAGVPDGSPSAAAESGRWVICIRRAVRAGRSAAKASRKTSGRM